MFRENRWHVMRVEIGRSSSYADPPKHCWTDNEGWRACCVPSGTTLWGWQAAKMPARRFRTVILIILGVLSPLMLVGCDARMSLRVTVRDRSGVELKDVAVRVAIAKDGRELWREITPDDGSVQVDSTYGFRSGPRLLIVDKDHYKTFSAALDPRREYTCQILLRSEAEVDSSSGSCAAR